jgi:hypothetical protein
MGVRLKHGINKITIKLHGPFNGVPLNPTELQSEAIKLLKSYNHLRDYTVMVEKLACDLRDKYCDGNALLYVEVILMTDHNITHEEIYGATAEKVLVS